MIPGASEGVGAVPARPGGEPVAGDIDTGLVCLLLMARLLGVPADGEHLRHQFGRRDAPFGDIEILRAAGTLGLKARRLTVRWARLAATPLPAIAICRDGRYLLLARAEADRVIVHDPAASQALALSREVFEQQWAGQLILMTPRLGGTSPARAFGFAWFIPAFMKYRRFLGEAVLASFFLQIFALLTPIFTQVVVDKVLVHKAVTTLEMLAVGMIGLAVFEVVLTGLRTYIVSHTSNRIDVELGARLFRHLLDLPLAYFEARRVGDSVARVRELENIRQFLTGSTVTLAVDAVFAVVFLVVMFFYSPLLTWIVIGALPVYILLSIAITPVIRARLNERFDRGAENQAFLVESINGIQTLKALAVEPQMRRTWEEQLASYVSASFRAVQLMNVTSQIASFVQKVTTIAILWAGATWVMRGSLTVGELMAFTMLAGRVSGPVLRIVQLWQEFQQAGISVRRLGDVLNAIPEPSRLSRTTLPSLIGRVVFDQVTFRYRVDGPQVLRGISFEVSPGDVIGLVGRSGSGKSTIAKLLQRLYVPESGRVLIDGIDLAQVDPVWLRRQVGVVLQENFLFNRSVRDNIALADSGLAMERVVHAAQLAGAHDFIVSLPEGYDTRVGEHGCSLSGGQRQRIAIARALVTNPRILIFDEATSALDYESEFIIQQNLAQICRGRTVFIIAHRLSTVRPADRIVVIDHGGLVEEGSHDDLVQAAGPYARLYGHQNGHVVTVR